jgi:hypothetical protein
MRITDIFEEDTLTLPNIDVGDSIKVGKFKNRKAIVKGFTTDDHNQPVLKTTKGDQKLFKPRISKLEETDRTRGTYTAEQAKRVGDCAIVALAHITGKTWEEVFEVAQPYFGRTGLGISDESRILRHFGWAVDAYYKMPWMLNPMTVRAGEAWLRENDPEAKILAAIYVDGMLHSIAYTNGAFHNVLGAYKARLRLVYICRRV